MAKSFLGSIGETLTGETYGQTAQREKLQNERGVKDSTDFIAKLSASDAVNTANPDGTLYSLTDKGFSDMIKFQEVDDGEGGKKRMYPKAGLMSDILNSSNILKSHTDAETGELKDGKVAGIEENEDGSISIIIDTPQGFFPKTLGMTNDPRDQVLKMSKEEFKGLLDTQIAAGYARTRGEEMAKGSAYRQGAPLLAQAQEDESNQVGEITREIEDGVAAGEIDPLEGARMLEEISKDFIKLQKEKKAESTQPQETPTEPAEVQNDSGPSMDEIKTILAVEKPSFTKTGALRDSISTKESAESTSTSLPIPMKTAGYIKNPKNVHPFGINDKNWNTLTPSERAKLTKQETVRANTTVGDALAGVAASVNDRLSKIDSTPMSVQGEEDLKKLGSILGISGKKGMVGSVKRDKEVSKDLKEKLANSPEEYAKFAENPETYLLEYKKEDNVVADAAQSAETNEKDTEYKIPPMPTDVAGAKTWLTENESSIRSMAKDGEIINRVKEVITKYDIQKPEDLKRMPPLDRKLNVTMMQVAATIAESSIGSGNNDAAFNATFLNMMNLGQTGTVQNNSIQVQELDRRYDLDVAKFGESKAKSMRTASMSISNNQLSWKKYADGVDNTFLDKATEYQKLLVDIDNNWVNPVGSKAASNNVNAQFKDLTRRLLVKGGPSGTNIGRTKGKINFENLTPAARVAAQSYIGMTFQAYVETNGSDGLRDYIGDIFAGNDPDTLTAALENVRYRTKLVNIDGAEREVIDEIYFSKRGGETEGSIKAGTLRELFGTPFSSERQLLMGFIKKDNASRK